MTFDLACPDWFEKLQRGETPIADLPLDHAAGERAVKIFDKLHLPDVPGTPSLAEAGGEWQRDVVRAIWGSVDPETLTRLIGEVFWLVPKKNSKTTSSGAIGLVSLLMNQRRHADMLIVGPTQKISDIAFEQAKGMIEADPDGFLQKRFQIQEHTKTIKCRVTKARLMVRTFGADVLTGAKPVFVLLDEIHLLGSIASAEEVVRQIRGGFLPFPESLFLMITTQSDGPPAGVFKKELTYARGVRDGRITGGNLLPVLYEFPEAMQLDKSEPWKDPANWHLVTPNLGRSIRLPDLVLLYERAVEDGPDAVRGWGTQHLNIEAGKATHDGRWIGGDHWPSCAGGVTFEEILETCEVAVAGFDGGGLDDLAGLAIAGRRAVDRKWLFWFRAWAQTDVLDRRKSIATKLQDFAAAGHLTICPDDDPGLDLREIAGHIGRVSEAGLLPEEYAVGLDVYGVSDLVDLLLDPEDGPGLDAAQVVGIPQGFRLSSAIWGWERRLKAGTIIHDGSAMMTWVVGNAKTERRGNNVYVTKAASGVGKIDPLIAGFNAYQLMARNPVAKGNGLDDFLKRPVAVT